jgi:hypothetical protein
MTVIIVLAIYLGFAITAGFLLNNIKRKSWWVFILFNLFIFLPASLGLPMNDKMRVFAWIAAISLTLLFAFFSRYLPKWLTTGRVLCGYFGIVMMVIFLWGLFVSNLQSWYLLGIPAFLAAMLNFFHFYYGLSRGRGAV